MFFACHPLFRASSSDQPRSACLGGRPDARQPSFYHFSLSLSERPKVVFSRALFRFSAVYNDAPSATTDTARGLLVRSIPSREPIGSHSFRVAVCPSKGGREGGRAVALPAIVHRINNLFWGLKKSRRNGRGRPVGV